MSSCLANSIFYEYVLLMPELYLLHDYVFHIILVYYSISIFFLGWFIVCCIIERAQFVLPTCYRAYAK